MRQTLPGTSGNSSTYSEPKSDTLNHVMPEISPHAHLELKARQISAGPGLELTLGHSSLALYTFSPGEWQHHPGQERAY